MASKHFGSGSLNKLAEADRKLVLLAHKALEYASKMGKDFSVIETYRSPERQKLLYAAGLSTLKSGGKHNVFPSKALDFVPYHAKERALTGNPEQTRELAKKYNKSFELMNSLVLAEFQIIAMAFIQASKELEIPIIWGGDWNMDSSSFDTNFLDWGHIELC